MDMHLQGAPNVVRGGGLGQIAKPAYLAATVPVIRRGKSSRPVWIIVLVVVLVTVVVALLHFGVIRLPISAQNISSQSNINAFSTAQTPQGVMRIIDSHIYSGSPLNISYSGKVGLTLGAVTLSVPAGFGFAKGNGLFRLSFDVNYTGFIGFMHQIFNFSSLNASQQNRTFVLPSLVVSGLLIYNGTGVIMCMIKNSSFANCSYRQLAVPQPDILYSLLSSGSSNSTEGAVPVNYSGLLSDVNTSDYPVFKYEGQSTYGGQQCSLDYIGPAAIGNYSYTGSVCFSDLLGLPLHVSLKGTPMKSANSSLFKDVGFSVSFSANISSSPPSASGITSLPRGAVFRGG